MLSTTVENEAIAPVENEAATIVTAGKASGQSDGAVACVVTRRSGLSNSAIDRWPCRNPAGVRGLQWLLSGLGEGLLALAATGRLRGF